MAENYIISFTFILPRAIMQQCSVKKAFGMLVRVFEMGTKGPQELLLILGVQQ